MLGRAMTAVLIPRPPEGSHSSLAVMVGAVVAENRTPQRRVRRWESRRPAVQNWDSKVGAATDARTLIWLAYLLAYLGAQATTTLTATPCREGRNVARPSSSKTKVPPGLMASVLWMRALACHATVQA